MSMLSGQFRPWGQISWVLDRLPKHEWDLIGSLSTQDRCLTTYEVLRARGVLGEVVLLQVLDVGSPYEDTRDAMLDDRRQIFLGLGGELEQIETHDLFERLERLLTSFRGFASRAGGNLMIDISCLSKRFFFPLVKLILASDRFQNIIAAYTIPMDYAHEPLVEDPEPWTNLPMFLPPYPEPEEKHLIVGLGYEPLGLPQLIQGEDLEAVQLHLLFPFPATLPGVQKNWEFVRQLEPNLGKATRRPIRVNSYDVSEVYDRLLSLTNYGERYAILAPYGPKTMSLAMCLYAVSKKASAIPPAVHYTQPRIYNPRYSSGVKTIAGRPEVYAYCLRLAGVDLY